MTAPEIPAWMRASLDRELASATEGLLAAAADYDHLDVIEANVELANFLLPRLDPHALAAAAAALAIRLHRSGATDG